MYFGFHHSLPRSGRSAQVDVIPQSILNRDWGIIHPDGAYGTGVWLQVSAKFGLVGLVGVLRFHVNREVSTFSAHLYEKQQQQY